MATSNFHNVNASNIFAVQLEDEWAFDDLIYNLKAEFDIHNDYSDSAKSDPNELRSYPSTSIGSFSNSIVVDEDEVEVFVTPVIRSGYYDGCNLDWHVRCYLNGYEEDEWETTPEVKSLVDGYVEFIENIYSQYSDKLGVTAQFSNGETIYHKIA